jgi:23S rRNA (uridine2552-2'-O)-methyltransferase
VLDFLEDGADEKVKAWLDGPADVVMSDMAASASGHKQTDHLRIVALVRGGGGAGLRRAGTRGHLRGQGAGRRGGGRACRPTLKQRFDKVANVKPPASRSDSSEKFVVATGFRG